MFMHDRLTETTHQLEACMYIGKVAELTGASRKAIRLYESLGLIPAPPRKGKYRLYSQRDVFLVHMIKRAQSVGFNLSELTELIADKVKNNRFPLKIANALFDKKRAALRAQVDTLLELEQRLLALREEMNRTFG
jgi:DNA-binding transcriptional MerR regulator